MISLVDDTFSDRRSISEASRMVGKEEKSSGFSIKSVMVKIRIANPKEAASPTSSTQEGTGRIIITMIAIRASANSTVGLKRLFASSCGTSGCFHSNSIRARLPAGLLFSGTRDPSRTAPPVVRGRAVCLELPRRGPALRPGLTAMACRMSGSI